MKLINIFYQVRQDGGVRFGLEVDGELILHDFHEGQAESDPVLVWYIDLRCKSDDSSFADPESAQLWLSSHANDIQEALLDVSRKFNSGVDNDGVPHKLKVKSKSGLQFNITTLAIPRHSALDLGKNIAQLAKDWKRLVNKLDSLLPV